MNLIEQLKAQAQAIAREDHATAVNTMQAAASRIAELEADKSAGFEQGRFYACSLLSQLVYSSDGAPLDQYALLDLCERVETEYSRPKNESCPVSRI